MEHVFDEHDLGVTLNAELRYAELRFDEHIARKGRVANSIVGKKIRSYSYLDYSIHLISATCQAN